MIIQEPYYTECALFLLLGKCFALYITFRIFLFMFLNRIEDITGPWSTKLSCRRKAGNTSTSLYWFFWVNIFLSHFWLRKIPIENLDCLLKFGYCFEGLSIFLEQPGTLSNCLLLLAVKYFFPHHAFNWFPSL